MENFIKILVVQLLMAQNKVFTQTDMKSSLTFVIDDTGSMSDDIDQVVSEANNIFDTVMNSDASQIEEFVLVTFNDPDVHLRTVTKSKENFKTELQSIRVTGGGDCPEYSLSGIEEALLRSRPASYLYVFTDAASTDFGKYDTVNELAKEKGCQIVFILTGICDPGEGSSDVYYRLAESTRGQVFNLYKNEVHQILNYVKEQVKSRKTVIASKKFPAGTHNFDYTVDGNTKELVVSVSGLNPRIDIYDPEGLEAETEGLVNTDRIAVVKVTEVKPGVYKAEVKSDTEMTVVVSGTNTMHFEHGFSLYEPTSIEETAARPFPEKMSYLSIKLTVEGAVELTSVQILDLNYKIIEEIPLDLIDVKDNFYVTAKTFIPPNDLFRIAIKGFDIKSKTLITRFGLVPIKHQDIRKEVSTEKAPIVKIIGTSVVDVPYEEPVQFKCKVSGFPKPIIIWEDKNGHSVSSTVNQIEVPYDYVSYIEIESVKDNNTYTCRASNDHGNNSKQVYVKTKRTRYFDLVQRPNDAVIELEKGGRFVCQVDAAPPVTIQWYRRGREIRNSTFYEISPVGTVLVIKKMTPKLVGKYSCKAKNDYHRKVFTFIVKTLGIEQPEIDKTIKESRVREGEDVKLSCRVIRGVPKPALRWVAKKAHSVKKIKASETIALRKVTRDDAGTYRCLAYNEVGEDLHYVDLIVEYPPVISDIPKSTKVIDGEAVHIPCAVDGIPVPAVRWLLNNDEIKNSKKYWVHKDFSISFKAVLNTTGNFTCVATNTYGSANISTIVDVSVPATIDTPKESVKEVAVGSDVSLECYSHGYAIPSLRWIFFSNKHKSTQILRPDTRGSLRLPRVQVTEQGYYTCVATNTGGSTNITYEIKVLSPPYIVREPGLKLTAVSGDLVFRIPCKTLGSPTPEIVWMTKGYLLSKGTDWYDYGSDGSLIIKNVDKESEGYYTCQATNRMGKAEESFYFEVKEHPDPESTKNTLVIAEGNSSKVPCEVPHKKTDVLRWYKDGKQLLTNELKLEKVKPTDSGLYICRVSNFYSSKSGFVDVRVGYKPRLLYTDHKEKNSHIEFREGETVVMDCSAGGEPAPKVTWWYDGHKLNEKGMKNTLRMTFSKRGTYFCLAENIFGHVVRSFEISTQECKLNIQRELTGNQPLILSLNLKLSSFESIDGSVRIPIHEKVVISCPEGFVKFPRRTEIHATCDKDTNFIVEETNYKFADLKCREEIQPKVESLNKTCLSKDSELIKIGYDMRGSTLEVYEVCYSINQKLPLFVKQEITSMSDIHLRNPKWYDSPLAPFNFNQMYDSSIQLDYISSELGKWFHIDDDCRFSKRQLVDPRSVSPGLPQVATYSHLNVVPHWSTCNEKNWESIEKRVRRLVKKTRRPLQVWTGISQQLQLTGASKKEYLFLSDERGQKQPIPKYFWKVVLDPLTEDSLAIIQVNIPDFLESDISRYTLCRDICSRVAWMKSNVWRNVDRGYTYCCNTKDFESAFGYNGFFNSTKVLYKAV